MTGDGHPGVDTPRDHHHHGHPVVGGQAEQELTHAQTNTDKASHVETMTHPFLASGHHQRTGQHSQAKGSEQKSGGPRISEVVLLHYSWHGNLHHAERGTQDQGQNQQRTAGFLTPAVAQTRQHFISNSGTGPLGGQGRFRFSFGWVIRNLDSQHQAKRHQGKDCHHGERPWVTHPLNEQPAKREPKEGCRLSSTILKGGGVDQSFWWDEQWDDGPKVWRYHHQDRSQNHRSYASEPGCDQLKADDGGK